MKILSCKNISYTYPETQKKALENISFDIFDGEYIAVLGKNGSGKSTLSKLLFGFLQPTQGSIDYLNNDFIIGFVQQEPRYQIIASTVDNDIKFGPENLQLSKSEIICRTQSALKITNLTDIKTEKTINLSLGQTQKLALAGILALNPKLLILDEAVSMIDPKNRTNILSVIDELNKKGTTIIHITHDIDEAFRAQKIIVIDNGEIQFNGTKQEFREKTVLFSEIFGSLDSLVFKRNQFAKNKDFNKNKTSLVLQNISFEYLPNKTVINNLSLAFKAGTITAIMGESGSGKSTLFEIMSGLLQANTGSVFIDGNSALALQDSDTSLFKSVVADDVAFGPINNGLSGKELKDRIKFTMDQCLIPFDEYKDRLINSLSGGEKKKASLAGIFALDTSVILLDEPGSSLDPSSREKLFTILQTLADQGKTIIFSTHRLEESFAADRLITIANGSIVSDSNPILLDTQLDNKESQYTKHYSLLKSLRNISVSDYTNKKTLVHKLQPLTKLLIFLAIFTVSLIFTKPLTMGIACIISLIYSFFAKFPFKKIIIRTLKILPWIIFFFIFQVLLFPILPTDKILFSFYFIKLTDSNILSGIQMLMHFISAMICISTFIYSTEETEFIDGLKSFLYPLTKIHIPTKYFIVFLLLVIRFIPLLTEETSHIIKTQIIRNGIKDSKSFIGKIKAILPILIPIVMQTLKRANNFAEALQARYFY